MSKQNHIKQLRRLLESEVREAEIVIATKKFSQSMQEMIEKIGRLQNEDLPPLTDQMRENYGSGTAHSFHEKTQSTLQSVLDSLYSAKEEIDRAVQDMAVGNLNFETDMDMDAELDAPEAEPGFGADAEVDAEVDVDIDAEGDEEGILPDADVEEPLGRQRNESIQELYKKIQMLESRIGKKKGSSKA